MTKIKVFTALIISFVSLFVSGHISLANAAPRLYVDPPTFTTVNGTDFQVTVGIDMDTQLAAGAKATLTYPAADLDLKSVTKGDFFTDFSAPTKSGGNITIQGFFSQQFGTKGGTGTFAVLTFTPKKNSGSGDILFTCSGSGSDTYILDANVTNLLTCGLLNKTTLTYSGQDSQTPTPGPTDNNSNNNNSGGSTGNNACGVGCSSDSNCIAGLFCYTNVCRNPACMGNGNCLCTPKPTTKPKVITKATIAPTPQVVELAQYEQPSDFIVPTATPEAEVKSVTPLSTYLLYGGIFILLCGILFTIVKALNKNKQTPPPTQMPPVQTPPMQMSSPIEPPPTEVPPIVPPIQNPPVV
jgi:hypothetical protein